MHIVSSIPPFLCARQAALQSIKIGLKFLRFGFFDDGKNTYNS